jgi:uncharacterized protein (DUF1499 family)
MIRAAHTLLVMAGLALVAGCLGVRPSALGVRDGRLAACPFSPNCVSSQASDSTHRVEPLRLTESSAAALSRMADLVRTFPRASVVDASENYLRAEFRSAILRFVDDVEFFADEAAGVIHIRSASRLGFSDLGVNRRRVGALRARWIAAP